MRMRKNKLISGMETILDNLASELDIAGKALHVFNTRWSKENDYGQRGCEYESESDLPLSRTNYAKQLATYQKLLEEYRLYQEASIQEEKQKGN